MFLTSFFKVRITKCRFFIWFHRSSGFNVVGRLICTCPVVYRYKLNLHTQVFVASISKALESVWYNPPNVSFVPPWRFNSISVVICTPFSLKQDVHVSFTLYLKSFFDLTKKEKKDKKKTRFSPSLLALCIRLVPVGLSCLPYVFTNSTPTRPTPK
jgi:hypothetical protein